MASISINRRIWKGSFSYEVINPDEIVVVVTVPFTMEVEMEKNSFVGFRVDDESKDLFDEPVKVKGFIENDFISFIIQYPHDYYMDYETGEAFVEKDMKHPGVTYEGSFDHQTNSYKGEWIILVAEELDPNNPGDYIEQLLTGTWEMRRK